MIKTFSPVRLYNPTSLQQFTKICPGQEISMYLDKDIYGEHAVDVSTDLLEVDSTSHKNGKLYTIRHPKELQEWSEYSSVMLGELWIDGANSIGKVSVMLETTNPQKSNIRTVINPDCMDMRMYPYNILEVILYDKRFGFHDEWNFEWKPNIDVGIRELGYDHVCLHSWEQYYGGLEHANYLYARLPRADAIGGMLTRQHHFWFSFDHKSFKMIAEQNSIVHAGNIVFKGISNRYQLQYAEKTQYNLSLYVDCRKRCFREMQETSNIKPRNESAPTTGLISYKPSKQVVDTKPVLPDIRDVDIRIVEIAGFVGCKILPAINESYKPKLYDNWLFEDDIDCFMPHQQYPQIHNRQWWRKWN